MATQAQQWSNKQNSLIMTMIISDIITIIITIMSNSIKLANQTGKYSEQKAADGRLRNVTDEC